jgi:hypothetical protein
LDIQKAGARPEEADKHCRPGISFSFSISPNVMFWPAGVSTIVELAIDVVDNYGGKLIICGLTTQGKSNNSSAFRRWQK